jgi:hypothetical protein
MGSCNICRNNRQYFRYHLHFGHTGMSLKRNYPIPDVTKMVDIIQQHQNAADSYRGKTKSKE